MEHVTDKAYVSSEQRKEVTPARQNRYSEDTCKIIEALKRNNPFSGVNYLRNIMNGLVAV
jgi:hypothetical protein